MKTTKTTNSFKEFYSLLPNVPGYSRDMAEEIKEQLVSAYSEGKTSSLKEMKAFYPADFNQMMFELRKKTKVNARYTPDGEKWRRRVIAVLCSYIDGRGMRFDSRQKKIAYAMTIACRASGVDNFNRISISALQRVYNTFGSQKSYQEVDDVGYGDATISDWTNAVNDALAANKLIPSKMNNNQ